MESANTLFDLGDEHRVAAAGYLYGLAGETALKAMMVKCGMQETVWRSKHNGHFPNLLQFIANQANGRLAAKISVVVQLAQKASHFSSWGIDIRYAASADISSANVAIWKQQAADLMNHFPMQGSQ
jgi:hypothetical protein